VKTKGAAFGAVRSTHTCVLSFSFGQPQCRVPLCGSFFECRPFLFSSPCLLSVCLYLFLSRLLCSLALDPCSLSSSYSLTASPAQLTPCFFFAISFLFIRRSVRFMLVSSEKGPDSDVSTWSTGLAAVLVSISAAAGLSGRRQYSRGASGGI